MDFLFAQSTNSSPSIMATLFPLLLMVSIVYFVMIRPQSKKRSEHEKELNSLTKGDRILTRGGIVGKIIEFQGKDESFVIIDNEYNNKFKIQKSFIVKKIINTKEDK